MPNSLFAERLWAIQPDALTPFMAHVRDMLLSRPASPPDKLARHEPSGGSALPPAGGFTPHAAFAFGGDAAQDKPYVVVNGVAVLSIRGVLSQFAVSTWWGGRLSSGMLNEIRPAIAAALADNAVGAVLLDINSPGGTVAGMKELSDYIASTGKASGKPMAAYANGTMASAAYSIGAATGRVFAPATASVGSVGIISVLPNYAGWNEKMGVSYAYLTAGKWKAVGNEDNPLTEKERAYIQARLDTVYQHFTDGVASGMGLDVAALETWADGQIFIASSAPQGLVTAIVADLETAIATLAKETTMDKATLAAQHPDVLASITREAAEQATAQAATQHAAQLKDRTEACVAAVRATAGEDAATRVQALLDQNLTAAQIAAVAGLMPAPPKADVAAPDAPDASAVTVAKSEADKILEGLTTAHAAPLAGAPGKPGAETPAQFGKRLAALVGG